MKMASWPGTQPGSGGHVEVQDVEGDRAVEHMVDTNKSRLGVSLLTSLEDLARLEGCCKVVLNLASRRAWSD